MKRLLTVSIISVILDQVIKFVISFSMTLNNSISVIKDFFYITYVNNYGAAWSIFTGNRLFLILIGIAVLVVIYYFFIRNNKLSKIEDITYGLLIGGIIGNLIDRVIHGYVIDYLDFYILGYDYPVFNLADMCIVGSVLMLIYLTFKGEKYDNSRK